MNLEILTLHNDYKKYDDYVYRHPNGGPYLLSNWINSITKIYNHTIYYLIALKKNNHSYPHENHRLAAQKAEKNYEEVVGILPLIHIKHWLFGNSMVSMPFCDNGGVLANDADIELILIEASIQLAEKLRIPLIELRQNQTLFIDKNNYESHVALSAEQHKSKIIAEQYLLKLHGMNKVGMLLDLPDNPDRLMNSFKAKLRSQIRKPVKEGLKVTISGIELLDDFYDIFAINMRDLGSPVHSKNFIGQVLRNFSEQARIFIVYRGNQPIACSLTLGFKDTLINPWASSLRQYSDLAPNMLLYWSMLEFGCQQGYHRFDFGRSTYGEGTYRFKEQWGCKSEPLYWYHLLKINPNDRNHQTNKDKIMSAVKYWKILPVSLTKIIGPSIRKYISL